MEWIHKPILKNDSFTFGLNHHVPSIKFSLHFHDNFLLRLQLEFVIFAQTKNVDIKGSSSAKIEIAKFLAIKIIKIFQRLL